MPTAADNRARILEVALEVLGKDPGASMADVAAAAGVVRRTVYGHFPSRTELVVTLTEQAAGELLAVLGEVDAPDRPADEVWAAFVSRIWPLTRRYRVLLALRRGEFGDQVHAALAPVDDALGRLVRRGQDDGDLARHLPALVLGQLAYAAVFTVAEHGLTDAAMDAGTAAVTSLLVLGVPEERAVTLART